MMAGFGIYESGTSLAHRLDPRIKVTIVAMFILAGFLARGWVALVVISAFACLMLAAAGKSPLRALTSIRPFAPLLFFIGLFDAFFVSSGEVWWQAGPLALSSGGLAMAADSLVRFCAILLGTSELMHVTSPTELSDAALLMLAPLRRVGLKVDGLALALGMTLRFIPVISEEMTRIKEAQTMRHAHFDRGGPLARLRSYLPVIVPLFMGVFHRSGTLTYAVANRGFSGAEGARTSYRVYRLEGVDAGALVALGIFVAALVAACVLPIP